jgi:hypothetical protein
VFGHARDGDCQLQLRVSLTEDQTKPEGKNQEFPSEHNLEVHSEVRGEERIGKNRPSFPER